MVRGVVPGLTVVRWEGDDRRSRKSQPPLGDLAVKGAVRQRGTEFMWKVYLWLMDRKLAKI